MQKFNAVVERPIRTVVEVVAVSRHANTPHKFMHLATLRSENAESIHRKLHGGTVDVPLWRFNGSKISLILDRYHPFGVQWRPQETIEALCAEDEEFTSVQ